MCNWSLCPEKQFPWGIQGLSAPSFLKLPKPSVVWRGVGIDNHFPFRLSIQSLISAGRAAQGLCVKCLLLPKGGSLMWVEKCLDLWVLQRVIKICFPQAFSKGLWCWLTSCVLPSHPPTSFNPPCSVSFPPTGPFWNFSLIPIFFRQTPVAITLAPPFKDPFLSHDPY